MITYKYIPCTIRDFLNESIVIDIYKNTEPAPYLGSRFGQDVEPKGTYVIQGKIKAKGYMYGKAELKNTLHIDVNEFTLVEYKRELAKKYKAK
jgi:hypothetical protein